MFRSNIHTVQAGPFGGGMVVSMRPIKYADIEKARAISEDFPLAHGALVHVGDPKAIGILDISSPDYGDAVPVEEDEVVDGSGNEAEEPELSALDPGHLVRFTLRGPAADLTNPDTGLRVAVHLKNTE